MQGGLPKTLTFHGQSRCLKHLAPFTHRLKGHGPKGTDLVVRITFGSHVFSKSEGTGRHDFIDESSNRRYFCEDRYAFSLTLTEEIKKILDQNVYTWEAQDRNQAANLAVLAPATVQLVSGAHNVIVYFLHKSSVPGIDVEMVVKSCYMMEVDFKRHPKRGKIRSCVKTVCFKGGRIPKN